MTRREGLQMLALAVSIGYSKKKLAREALEYREMITEESRDEFLLIASSRDPRRLIKLVMLEL